MMCGVCGSGKTTYAKQKEKMDMSDFRLMKNYGKLMEGKVLITRIAIMKNYERK